MIPSKTISIGSTIIILLSFSPNVLSQTKLYYNVKNVFKFSKSSISVENNLVTFDILNEKDTEVESSESINDKFLVPYILSKIKEHSKFEETINLAELKPKPKIGKKLVISINKFNNNLEYQFHFTDIAKNHTLNERSFFINPDDQNYQFEIEKEIQLLFKNTGYENNEKPIAKIRIDGELYKNNKSYYKAHSDTIHLSASSSFDSSTPQSHLRYYWKTYKTVCRSYEEAFIPGFNLEESEQKLNITEPGEYIFKLIVSDGVDSSCQTSITINIINRPNIELNKNEYNIISQDNFFNKRRTIIEANQPIGYSINNFNDNCSLIVDYKYSLNNFHKYFSKESKEVKAIFLQNGGEFKIPGIELKATKISDKDEIKFNLSKNIEPGTHKYIIYTNNNNKVFSAADTLSITYKEKSSICSYIGYDYIRVAQNKKDSAFRDIRMSVFNIGLRGYIGQRFSLDGLFIFPIKINDRTNVENREIGLLSFKAQANYDILPWSTENMHNKKFPLYLSAFISWYQLHISDINKPFSYNFFGGGGKLRFQPDLSKFKYGIWSFELELGFHGDCSWGEYSTITGGLNLIYNIWKY